MGTNTSISLGSYFESFVRTQIEHGRYKNASEVIRAGLRLLEEEETRIAALRQAIDEGTSSGIDPDFDPQAHLAALKAQKHGRG